MNSHTGIAIRFLFAHGTRAKAKNDQGPFQSSLHMGLKRNAFKKQHNTWTSWSCSNSLLIDFKMKIKTSNHNLLQTTWFSTTYPFLSQIIFLQIFLYFIPLIPINLSVGDGWIIRMKNSWWWRWAGLWHWFATWILIKKSEFHQYSCVEWLQKKCIVMTSTGTKLFGKFTVPSGVIKEGYGIHHI